MKSVITPTYTFTPSAQTLDLSAISGFSIKRLYAVLNQTRGTLLYAAGTTGYGYTSNNSGLLTLAASTAGMGSNDDLMIIYDDGTTPLPAGAAQDSTLTSILTALQSQKVMTVWTDDTGAFFILQFSPGVGPVWITPTGAASSAPGTGMRPAGGESAVTTSATYQAVSAGTGFSIGDYLSHIVTSDPTTGNVIGYFWLNISTNTKLSSIPPANSFVPVTALPTNAAQENNGNLAAIKTALGSPFQAGASIGNTTFGISGLLPAFAVIPTVNIGTIPLAAGAALAANQSSINADGGALSHITNFPATQAVTLSGQSVSITGAADTTATTISPSTSTNGFTVLSFASVSSLKVGMLASGAGLTQGSFISAVNTSNNTITLMTNPIVTSGTVVSFRAFNQKSIGNFDTCPGVWINANSDGSYNYITVGAMNGDRYGISQVIFYLEGNQTSVTFQTINPQTNTVGYTVRVASPINIDGPAALYAKIIPVNGYERVIRLPIVLNTNGTISRPTVYVDQDIGIDPVFYTTASSSTGATTLTVASTVGVVNGMFITGTGIPANTTIQSHTSTSITLNKSITTAIAVNAYLNIFPLQYGASKATPFASIDFAIQYLQFLGDGGVVYYKDSFTKGSVVVYNYDSQAGGPVNSNVNNLMIDVLPYMASAPFTVASNAASGDNTLSFAATTGILVGALVTGVGIPVGTVVKDMTTTLLILSNNITSAISSGATVTVTGGAIITRQIPDLNTMTVTVGSSAGGKVVPLTSPSSTVGLGLYVGMYVTNVSGANTVGAGATIVSFTNNSITLSGGSTSNGDVISLNGTGYLILPVHKVSFTGIVFDAFANPTTGVLYNNINTTLSSGQLYPQYTTLTSAVIAGVTGTTIQCSTSGMTVGSIAKGSVVTGACFSPWTYVVSFTTTSITLSCPPIANAPAGTVVVVTSMPGILRVKNGGFVNPYGIMGPALVNATINESDGAMLNYSYSYCFLSIEEGVYLTIGGPSATLLRNAHVSICWDYQFLLGGTQLNNFSGLRQFNNKLIGPRLCQNVLLATTSSTTITNKLDLTVSVLTTAGAPIGSQTFSVNSTTGLSIGMVAKGTNMAATSFGTIAGVTATTVTLTNGCIGFVPAGTKIIFGYSIISIGAPSSGVTQFNLNMLSGNSTAAISNIVQAPSGTVRATVGSTSNFYSGQEYWVSTVVGSKASLLPALGKNNYSLMNGNFIVNVIDSNNMDFGTIEGGYNDIPYYDPLDTYVSGGVIGPSYDGIIIGGNNTNGTATNYTAAYSTKSNITVTSSSGTRLVMSSLSGIYPGMPVSGTGIPAGTYVVATDTQTLSVTLSQPITSSVTSATFGQMLTSYGSTNGIAISASSGNVLTCASGVIFAATVGASITGTNIPTGTYVTGTTATTIILSQNVTGTVTTAFTGCTCIVYGDVSNISVGDSCTITVPEHPDLMQYADDPTDFSVNDENFFYQGCILNTIGHQILLAQRSQVTGIGNVTTSGRVATISAPTLTVGATCVHNVGTNLTTIPWSSPPSTLRTLYARVGCIMPSSCVVQFTSGALSGQSFQVVSQTSSVTTVLGDASAAIATDTALQPICIMPGDFIVANGGSVNQEGHPVTRAISPSQYQLSNPFSTDISMFSTVGLTASIGSTVTGSNIPSGTTISGFTATGSIILSASITGTVTTATINGTITAVTSVSSGNILAPSWIQSKSIKDIGLQNMVLCGAQAQIDQSAQHLVYQNSSLLTYTIGSGITAGYLYTRLSSTGALAAASAEAVTFLDCLMGGYYNYSTVSTSKRFMDCVFADNNQHIGLPLYGTGSSTFKTISTSAASNSGTNTLYFSNTAGLFVGMVLSPSSSIPVTTVITSVSPTSITINNMLSGNVALNYGVSFTLPPTLNMTIAHSGNFKPLNGCVTLPVRGNLSTGLPFVPYDALLANTTINSVVGAVQP